ncbi:MAG: ABC transporter ATP-binding protein [Pseudomonadales bacterium]|jgi:ABC-type multidrug transport system ATPase subunit|nr:ABC transporter ATP-binding protein [Pseudomonadales bacterium]MDP7593965.1 ABC transporter ATP-binding protein [Pseudomonadales bacterium]|tara:strand:+ start:610 stop:1590 length:981 start_codon:yes stop_codon:yes gene_type:complete
MTSAIQQSTTSGPAIEVRQLSHTYKGGHKALDCVDLTCGIGVFGLLGPNGAGKSTLMKILCTLMRPSEGQVRVCGHDVTTESPKVRPLLGYLPQDFGAWRLHRVEEVLDTLAQLSGMLDAKRRRARVTEVLEQVGLGEVGDRKVKKLSGGMVRRLGVAQALVHEPQVLVVDEPTVGLDPEERIRFRQLMADLGRDRTILLSTHIVADLGAACREIALLDAGRIIFQGPPAQLVADAVGQVFEVVVTESDFEAYERDYDIVSTNVAEGQMTLRGVAPDNRLPPAATAVAEPTLEESYMAFMAARGRTSAARQDEEPGVDNASAEGSE